MDEAIAAKQEDSVIVGPLTVFFPSGSLPSFWWSHDLAELFGLETNAEAERALREGLKRRPSGRLGIDQEADAVFVRASNPALMVHVLEVVRDLCLSPFRYGEAEIAAARVALERAPKPKKQRWRVGSIFAIPLSDGTWAFGQVVASPGPKLGATLALYAERASTLDRVDFEAIVTAPTITLLPGTAMDIDDGKFPVLGDFAVGVDARVIEAVDERCSWDGIGTMAEAWFGLYPWNGFYRANFLDAFLVAGARRPKDVWMLSEDEHRELRTTDRHAELLAGWVQARLRSLGASPA